MKKVWIVALSFAVLLIGSVPTNLPAAAESEDLFSYVADFNDVDAVNEHFAAFYLTQFMGALTPEQVGTEASPITHWVAKDGVLSRVGDIRPDEGSQNIAMLFFKDRRFLNFELTVDIMQGSDSILWAPICIRTEEMGKHYAAEGCSFYFDVDGTFKTWGNGFHGGPFLIGRMDNYSPTAWHTYKITVSGSYMTIMVDDTTMLCRLPAFFYHAGYVSILSVNNNTKVRNFSIRELPDTGVAPSDFPAKQGFEASTAPDSLDNLIVGT